MPSLDAEGPWLWRAESYGCAGDEIRILAGPLSPASPMMGQWMMRQNVCVRPQQTSLWRPMQPHQSSAPWPFPCPAPATEWRFPSCPQESGPWRPGVAPRSPLGSSKPNLRTLDFTFPRVPKIAATSPGWLLATRRDCPNCKIWWVICWRWVIQRWPIMFMTANSWWFLAPTFLVGWVEKERTLEDLHQCWCIAYHLMYTKGRHPQAHSWPKVAKKSAAGAACCEGATDICIYVNTHTYIYICVCVTWYVYIYIYESIWDSW